MKKTFLIFALIFAVLFCGCVPDTPVENSSTAPISGDESSPQNEESTLPPPDPDDENIVFFTDAEGEIESYYCLTDEEINVLSDYLENGTRYDMHTIDIVEPDIDGYIIIDGECIKFDSNAGGFFVRTWLIHSKEAAEFMKACKENALYYDETMRILEPDDEGVLFFYGEDSYIEKYYALTENEHEALLDLLKNSEWTQTKQMSGNIDTWRESVSALVPADGYIIIEGIRVEFFLKTNTFSVRWYDTENQSAAEIVSIRKENAVPFEGDEPMPDPEDEGIVFFNDDEGEIESYYRIPREELFTLIEHFENGERRIISFYEMIFIKPFDGYMYMGRIMLDFYLDSGDFYTGSYHIHSEEAAELIKEWKEKSVPYIQ